MKHKNLSTKVKVALLAMCFYPDFPRGGGTYARNIYEALQESEKFEVYVITLRHRMNLRLKNVIQVRTPILIRDTVSFYFGFFVYTLLAVIQTIKIRPHVIHATTVYEAVIPILLRRRYILSLHDTSPFEIGKVSKHILTLALKTASCILVLTSYVGLIVRRYIEAYSNYKKPEIVKLPAAVRVSEYAATSSQASQNLLKKHPELMGKRIILYVGALAGHKGIVQLVNAMEIVSKEVSNCHLVISGPPEDKEILKFISIKALSSNNISYLGIVNPCFLKALYSMAEICVFPSVGLEGQGIVLLEAMAAGKPIIAGNLAVFRETAAEAAVYVNGNSPSEIASAIIAMLRNEELRAKMKELSTSRGKLYDLPRFKDSLERIYTSYTKAS